MFFIFYVNKRSCLHLGAARYHFVRSDNGMAKYETLENGRLCVTFPFTGPQGNELLTSYVRELVSSFVK